jgi:hypothetical protein
MPVKTAAAASMASRAGGPAVCGYYPGPHRDKGQAAPLCGGHKGQGAPCWSRGAAGASALREGGWHHRHAATRLTPPPNHRPARRPAWISPGDPEAINGTGRPSSMIAPEVSARTLGPLLVPLSSGALRTPPPHSSRWMPRIARGGHPQTTMATQGIGSVFGMWIWRPQGHWASPNAHAINCVGDGGTYGSRVSSRRRSG